MSANLPSDNTIMLLVLWFIFCLIGVWVYPFYKDLTNTFFWQENNLKFIQDGLELFMYGTRGQEGFAFRFGTCLMIFAILKRWIKKID